MWFPRIVAFGVFACAAPAADSAACAACHRAIYESYQRTPMAATSGQAGKGVPAESFANAAFTHAASGFRYRVSRSGGGYWMDFEKAADGSLHGRKPLVYFAGSGAVARSYLMAADGFLYEAPVTYYSASARWDLSPAYGGYAYPYMTRAIVPGCLNCHASFLSVVAGSQNRFGSPPFREGGVACERCHGAGDAHIAKMQSGRTQGGTSIVNPAKLAAERAGQRMRAVPSLGRSAGDASGRRVGFLSRGRPAQRFGDGVRAGRRESGNARDQPLREARAERVQARFGRPVVVRLVPRSSCAAHRGQPGRLVPREVPELPRGGCLRGDGGKPRQTAG